MNLADELDDVMDSAITARATVDQFTALIHWGTRTLARIGRGRIAEIRETCEDWWVRHIPPSGWGRDAWYGLRAAIDSLLREAVEKLKSEAKT